MQEMLKIMCVYYRCHSILASYFIIIIIIIIYDN